MSAEAQFIDTNILVYLFDSDSPTKQSISRELLEENSGNLILSSQVLGEFYVTVTRKLARPLSEDQAIDAISAFGAFRVRDIHVGLAQAAVRRSARSKLSYWDSLIIETAREAGAATLLTEDLQHGQLLDGLLVFNPYADTSMLD